jgi:hypothetical protein
MLYRALADATLLIHLGFVLFVALGGLLALRWIWIAWFHLPAAAWGALIEFTGRVCPLTPLEQRLRILGGEEGYEGGFIDHYVTGWIYPDGLTRDMQIAIGIAVIAINVMVYGWVLAHRRSRGNGSAAGDLSNVGRTRS